LASTPEKKELAKAYSAWGAVCLFWGTTYLAIRIGVKVLPPALFAGIRFTIAGLIFFLFLRLRGYSLPNRKGLLDAAVVGIALLVTANGLVVWSEQWVPSGLAALIVATLPLWMAVFEGFLPSGDRLTVKKIAGIFMGFCGLVILFWPDLKSSLDMKYLRGVLVLFLAPCSWAAGSIYSKHRPIRTNPLMAASLQMIIAGFILMAIGASLGECKRFVFEPLGVGALVYLIIFGSIVGYGSFIYALSKLPVSKVSMYAYINPVIAVILGWVILGERMDGWMIIGTVVVLAGVVVVNSEKTPRKDTFH
jgi:drug/metabolite transporter (DMT)-like permease